MKQPYEQNDCSADPKSKPGLVLWRLAKGTFVVCLTGWLLGLCIMKALNAPPEWYAINHWFAAGIFLCWLVAGVCLRLCCPSVLTKMPADLEHAERLWREAEDKEKIEREVDTLV